MGNAAIVVNLMQVVALSNGLNEVNQVQNTLQSTLTQSGGFGVNKMYANSIQQSKTLLRELQYLLSEDSVMLKKASVSLFLADSEAAQNIKTTN